MGKYRVKAVASVYMCLCVSVFKFWMKNKATITHAQRDMNTQCKRQATNYNIRHFFKLKDLRPLCEAKVLYASSPPHIQSNVI